MKSRTRPRFSLRPSDHINLYQFAQSIRAMDRPAPYWYKVFVSYLVFFCEWFAIIFGILIGLAILFG